MKSVRKQLLFHLMAALLMTSIVVGIVTYISAREEIDELYDEHLHQIALALEDQKSMLSHSAGEPSKKTKLKGEEEFLIQIWDEKGGLIYSSHPLITYPEPDKAGFTTRSHGHEVWRSYATDPHGLILQVAQPLYAREELLFEITIKMLIPVLLQFPIMALFIWLAVGNSLESLSVISNGIRKRSENSLQPLDTDDVPEEVMPMVIALNELLSKLQASMQMQRRFTADAAHELRTPLTAVNLQLSLLDRSQNEQERVEAMDTLVKGVSRSIRLVEQLLAFARVEAEADYKMAEPIDVLPVVRETIQLFSGQAIQKNIDLGVAREEGFSCRFNLDGMATVLSNLVANALRYTPEGGRIDVSVYRDGNCGVLEVSDNGIGIPVDQRSRIFDRFYRIPGQDAQGTGLGLAIIKSILDKQGAVITVQDGLEGRGASFKIIFPAVSA